MSSKNILKGRISVEVKARNLAHMPGESKLHGGVGVWVVLGVYLLFEFFYVAW